MEFGDKLINDILDRKEQKEKQQEEENNRKLLEATHDETDCRFWDVDTTVQYIIWMFQKKSPDQIEEIVSKLIDSIKG